MLAEGQNGPCWCFKHCRRIIGWPAFDIDQGTIGHFDALVIGHPDFAMGQFARCKIDDDRGASRRGMPIEIGLVTSLGTLPPKGQRPDPR